MVLTGGLVAHLGTTALPTASGLLCTALTLGLLDAPSLPLIRLALVRTVL